MERIRKLSNNFADLVNPAPPARVTKDTISTPSYAILQLDPGIYDKEPRPTRKRSLSNLASAIAAPVLKRARSLSRTRDDAARAPDGRPVVVDLRSGHTMRVGRRGSDRGGVWESDRAIPHALLGQFVPAHARAQSADTKPLPAAPAPRSPDDFDDPGDRLFRDRDERPTRAASDGRWHPSKEQRARRECPPARSAALNRHETEQRYGHKTADAPRGRTREQKPTQPAQPLRRAASEEALSPTAPPRVYVPPGVDPAHVTSATPFLLRPMRRSPSTDSTLADAHDLIAAPAPPPHARVGRAEQSVRVLTVPAASAATVEDAGRRPEAERRAELERNVTLRKPQLDRVRLVVEQRSAPQLATPRAKAADELPALPAAAGAPPKKSAVPVRPPSPQKPSQLAAPRSKLSNEPSATRSTASTTGAASSTTGSSPQKSAPVARPASPQKPAAVRRSPSPQRTAVTARPASPQKPAVLARPASPQKPTVVARPASPHRPVVVGRPASPQKVAAIARPASPQKPVQLASSRTKSSNELPTLRGGSSTTSSIPQRAPVFTRPSSPQKPVSSGRSADSHAGRSHAEVPAVPAVGKQRSPSKASTTSSRSADGHTSPAKLPAAIVATRAVAARSPRRPPPLRLPSHDGPHAEKALPRAPSSSGSEYSQESWVPGQNAADVFRRAPSNEDGSDAGDRSWVKITATPSSRRATDSTAAASSSTPARPPFPRHASTPIVRSTPVAAPSRPTDEARREAERRRRERLHAERDRELSPESRVHRRCGLTTDGNGNPKSTVTLVRVGESGRVEESMPWTPLFVDKFGLDKVLPRPIVDPYGKPTWEEQNRMDPLRQAWWFTYDPQKARPQLRHTHTAPPPNVPVDVRASQEVDVEVWRGSGYDRKRAEAEAEAEAELRKLEEEMELTLKTFKQRKK